MTNHATFRLTVIAAALMAMNAQVFAEDAEPTVQELISPESSVSFGAGNLSGSNEQLGRYNGLNKDKTFGILDSTIRIRNDDTGTWMNLTTRNLGLDSREAKAEYLVQGNWGATIEYGETPSRNPNTFITGVRGVGTNQLQYGNIPANAAAVQGSLYPANQEVHLGTKRDTTSLNVVKYLVPNLSFNLSFKNEDKKGTQLWGRGVNPEFAVQPIDSNTQKVEGTLNYAGKQLQLLGGISASWFRNGNSYVDTIGGSQTSAAGANFSGGHTFLSLPLDNEALQYFVNGGYSFTKDSRLTFKASHSRAKQNDDLSALSNAIRATGATGSSGVDAVAPSRLNGRVDTDTYNLAFSTRPFDKLSIVAKWDYNKRDDKTPVQVFSTTAVAGGQTNNPHGFTKESAKLEGTYRLPAGFSLMAGVENEKRKHQLDFANDGAFEGTVKLRAKTDETTWRLQLRRAMSETVNGTLAYLHSKRDGSSWHNPETEVVAGLPGGYVDVSAITTAFTNPFAFADRKRDTWRLAVDWEPVEAVSLQFNYDQSNDNYDPAKSGLQKGEGQVLSMDASVALNQDWQVNAWASQDINKAHQIGITYDPRTTSATGLRDSNGVLLTTLPGSVGWLCSSANTGAGQCTTDLVWDAKLKDTGRSVGLGAKGKAFGKLTLGANLQWTENKSQYPINSNVPSYNTGANGAANGNRSKQGLPDITTTMTRIGLYGEYPVQKNLDIRVDFIHQQWKSDDWTWMEWNSAGTSLMPFTYMDGTQVVAKQKQTADFVGIIFNYKFQ